MRLLLRWKLISLNNQIMVISTCLMALATCSLVVASISQYWVMKEQTTINRNQLKTMTEQSKAIQTQLEETKKTTTQQFFIAFYEQWESDGMQKRRARLAESLLQDSIPKDLDDSPLVFLETLATASKKGLIDRDLLWSTFSVDVEGYWPAAEPYINQVRKSEKCKCLFSDLELFHKTLVEQDRENGEQNALSAGDKDAVRRFLKWEQARKITRD